jgi:predicted restriction endonuclease
MKHVKNCSTCGTDISHKKSLRASKCEKCARIPNEKSLAKIKYRSKNMRSVKMEILSAYDVSCAICGWHTASKSANGIELHQRGCEIHHIIPVSEGGKDVFQNCILLCPNHHKEADLGIITRSDLLTYVIKNKEDAILNRRMESLDIACNVLDNLF